MEFIFDCSHRYRTSERIERVSASNEWDIECEHEKINSISPSVHVLFCLLYKLSEDFRAISEDFRRFFKIVPKAWWTSPKIAEDCRRFPRRYRWCFDHTTPPLSDYVAIAMAILRQCDNNLIFLYVKLSYFYMWKYTDKTDCHCYSYIIA